MVKTIQILGKVQEYCTRHGYRFTAPRQAVLEVIIQSAVPIVAYDILDAVGEKTGQKPKPPTIYRAIDFLVEHGFVHRIESLNAFVMCEEGHRHAGSQFLICDKCRQVQEAHLCALPEALSDKADYFGFQPKSWSLEIHGLCGDCCKR